MTDHDASPSPTADVAGAPSGDTEHEDTIEGEDAPAREPVDIPTLVSDDVAFFAAIDGYLRGDASIDGGCLWLEDPSTRDPVAVVWPGLGGGFLSHEGARCDLGMDRYWLASDVGVAER